MASFVKIRAWGIWGLVLSPAIGFAALSVWHPVGDPQSSGNALIRGLDFLGTYGVRVGTFWPPPLLTLGTVLAFGIYKKSPLTRPAAWVGTGLLALWGLVTLVPYLVHVN